MEDMSSDSALLGHYLYPLESSNIKPVRLTSSFVVRRLRPECGFERCHAESRLV